MTRSKKYQLIRIFETETMWNVSHVNKGGGGGEGLGG